MSLHNLVNSSEWRIVEEKMKDAIDNATILDETKDFKDIAVEALANQKMRSVLGKFLSDMGFYKKEEVQKQKRTFK